MSGCNGVLCFHGAFNKKSDAERKAGSLKSKGQRPFILKKWVGKGRRQFRFVVATSDSGAAFNFGSNRGQRGKK